jgi:hypothetical protein
LFVEHPKQEVLLMKKSSPKETQKKVTELEPRNKTKIDFSKFKSELSEKDLLKFFPPATGIIYYPFFRSIETLSVTKTQGLGETNLTFIMPTIVQADAATPYASFDYQNNPSRKPAIQMHFAPGAYGATGSATYIMEFRIQTFGQTTFNLTGYAGAGSLQNAGTKVLNGMVTTLLIFNNVPAAQEIYGYLEQSAGAAWNWFSCEVHFPPLVFTL